MADAHDAELRSELGNYWTAPPQTPKRKQRAAYDFGDCWSGDHTAKNSPGGDVIVDTLLVRMMTGDGCVVGNCL
tara:strand:+ start:109 stop:330 length:222 start_codon:yes stop_codon:yes gene_type:complete